MTNEKEFSIRKNCVQQIKQSNCSINSLLPEHKLFEALGFNVRRQAEEIYRDTSNLIDDIIKVNRLDELTENPHLNILLQYDQNSSIAWREAVIERIENRK